MLTRAKNWHVYCTTPCSPKSFTFDYKNNTFKPNLASGHRQHMVLNSFDFQLSLFTDTNILWFSKTCHFSMFFSNKGCFPNNYQNFNKLLIWSLLILCHKLYWIQQGLHVFTPVPDLEQYVPCCLSPFSGVLYDLVKPFRENFLASDWSICLEWAAVFEEHALNIFVMHSPASWCKCFPVYQLRQIAMLAWQCMSLELFLP